MRPVLLLPLAAGCIVLGPGPGVDAPTDAPVDGVVVDSGSEGADSGDTATTTFVHATPPRTLYGCTIFPADTVFHADVRRLDVHPRDAAWRARLGHDAPVKLPSALDQSQFPAVRYGVPHTLADADTPRRTVTYDGLYPVAKQFPGPFPLPAGLDVQTGFDLQTIVVEHDACELYELIGYTNILGHRANGGAWFDLEAHGPAPEGWAVTASRVPILAVQVRADEIAAGRIDHAMAISIPKVARDVDGPGGDPLWPAAMSDGTGDDPDDPPMGAWFRLRHDVDLSTWPAPLQIVGQALKIHGAFLADTGGVPGTLTLKLEKSNDWRDAGGVDVSKELAKLQQHLTVGDLEIVDASPMRADPTGWRIR